MIDMLFYGILIIALTVMIWLGQKEDVSILMFFAGFFAVVIGASPLMDGVGTNITTTSVEKSYNITGNLTGTVNTSVTEIYNLPNTFTNYLSILLILLGLWMVLNESFDALGRKIRWR